MRLLSNLFLAGGVILLGVSAYLYLNDDGDARVTIDQPEREIAARPNEKIDVAFAIHNPRRQTARVVGLAVC